MQVLVDAREKLEIPWEHPNTYHAANQAILFHNSNELDIETFRQYAPYISRLWQDRAIKKAFDRRREFQLVRITKIVHSHNLFTLKQRKHTQHILLFSINNENDEMNDSKSHVCNHHTRVLIIKVLLIFISLLYYLFRAIPLATFSMNWIEYRALIMCRQIKIYCTVVRRQRVSLNLRLEYK
jgi:hypothetical protein